MGMEQRNTAENSALRIIVAAHKPYAMPQDAVYLPVHAGAARTSGALYCSDAQGDHISHKNGLYCELTALYWAWKNLPCGALGLAHYRRYLGSPGYAARFRVRAERIASGAEIGALLEKTPVILPVKRNYFIENRRNQFVRAHGRAGYDALREVLAQREPAYLPAFDASMRRTAGHCFNMFVMRRDLCDAYCEWLFGVLFAVESYMQERCPQEITPRLFGFLSERLLDCWLETNGIAFTELPVVHMEGQDWPRKAAAFLARKFGVRGRKA